MKTHNKKKSLLSLLIIVLCSCGSHSGAPGAVTAKNEMIIKAKDTIVKNRFANVTFASRYDTSCGMPLSAGVEDTLHYKNKIYGFCSKECKDDFISKLKKDYKK